MWLGDGVQNSDVLNTSILAQRVQLDSIIQKDLQRSAPHLTKQPQRKKVTLGYMSSPMQPYYNRKKN